MPAAGRSWESGGAAAIGAALGTLAGLGLTLMLGDPPPGPAFIVSLAVLAVAVSIAASLVPLSLPREGNRSWS